VFAEIDRLYPLAVTGSGYKPAQFFTELDLTIAGQDEGQLGGDGRGRGPVPPPAPESLQTQAGAYAKLFKVFLNHRDVINRVTFWGLNDRRSWRAGQSPLIFDGENQAKPALQAIASAAAR
jgi:GH35 family endo-1,4-beta-xylanase